MIKKQQEEVVHKITIHEELALLKRAEQNALEDGAPYVIFRNLSSTQMDMLQEKKYNYIARKYVPDSEDVLMAYTWLPNDKCDEIRKVCFK